MVASPYADMGKDSAWIASRRIGGLVLAELASQFATCPKRRLRGLAQPSADSARRGHFRDFFAGNGPLSPVKTAKKPCTALDIVRQPGNIPRVDRQAVFGLFARLACRLRK
jgi:hypothetical protein